MTNEELAARIQEGDTALVPCLWEQVRRYAALKALQYFNSHSDTCAAAGVTAEDLQQEAYFAFLDAIRYFAPDTGYTFLTYMKYPLQNAFNALCGLRTQKAGKAPLNHYKSLHTPIGDEEFTLEDTLEDESGVEELEDAERRIYNAQLHDVLEQCLATLPAAKESVIRARYYEGLTYTEISHQMGVSRNLCRNRELEGLRALRRGKSRRLLTSFEDDTIACCAYRSSFSRWKDTWTSSTEYAVLKLLGEV